MRGRRFGVFLRFLFIFRGRGIQHILISRIVLYGTFRVSYGGAPKAGFRRAFRPSAPKPRHDKSGLGFLADFRPLGAHGAPRELRERPRLEQECRLRQQSAPETTYKSHSWALRVFGTDRKNIKNVNDKFEAPQGLPSSQSTRRCPLDRRIRGVRFRS